MFSVLVLLAPSASYKGSISINPDSNGDTGRQSAWRPSPRSRAWCRRGTAAAPPSAVGTAATSSSDLSVPTACHPPQGYFFEVRLMLSLWSPCCCRAGGRRGLAVRSTAARQSCCCCCCCFQFSRLGGKERESWGRGRVDSTISPVTPPTRLWWLSDDAGGLGGKPGQRGRTAGRRVGRKGWAVEGSQLAPPLLLK